MVKEYSVGPSTLVSVDPGRVQLLLFSQCGLYEHYTGKALLSEQWHVWHIGPMTNSLYSRILAPLRRGRENFPSSYPFLTNSETRNIEFCEDPALLLACNKVMSTLGQCDLQHLYENIRVRWPLAGNNVSNPVRNKDLAAWAACLSS
jgi:uncharacterized phage-associated protein